MRNLSIEFEKRDRSRTYLYYDKAELEKGNFVIIGFFSIAVKSIYLKNFRKLQIPKGLITRLENLCNDDSYATAYLIGQIGRDDTYTSAELSGAQMLSDAVKLIQEVKNMIGGRLVILECKPIASLCRMYESNGFIDITEDDRDLKLYMKFI